MLVQAAPDVGRLVISLEVIHILPLPVGGITGSAVGEDSTGALVGGKAVAVGATAVRVGTICVLVGWMVVGTGLGVAAVVVSPAVTTSSGAGLPSLEDRPNLTVLSIASTKLYVALPVTMGVTSNSNQLLAASAPLSSMALLVREG